MDMDIEEAIDILNHLVFCGSCTTDPCKDCDRKNAKDTAIQGLRELQQYRQIGTVDECRAAMEKQTPKKVRFKTKNSVSLPCCPNCGETYCDCSGGENYCKNCGQKWEWGD